MQTRNKAPSAYVGKICRISGVEWKLMQSRIISLREFEKLLEQVIRESRSAATAHDAWLVLEMGARATLMVCDILIIGLESATDAPGVVVSKVYDGGKLLADTMTSGKIDSTAAWRMLAKNKAKIAELTAKGAGASKLSKALSLTQDLVGYAEAMWGFFSGASNQIASSSAGIRSSALSATHQLDRIRHRIREIEAELRACEPEAKGSLATLL